MDACRTPRNVGTADREDKDDTADPRSPNDKIKEMGTSASDTAVGKTQTPGIAVEQICYNCESQGAIKRSHTYQPGCHRYIQVASIDDMKRAAKGRKNGRMNLLKKLGRGTRESQGGNMTTTKAKQSEDRQRSTEEDQHLERKTKTKTRPRSSDSSSSKRTSSGKKKEYNMEKGNLQKKERASSSKRTRRNEEESTSSPDMVAVILGEVDDKKRRKTRSQQPGEEKTAEKRIQEVQPQRESTPSAVTEKGSCKRARVPPPEGAKVDPGLLQKGGQTIGTRAQNSEGKNPTANDPADEGGRSAG